MLNWISLDFELKLVTVPQFVSPNSAEIGKLRFPQDCVTSAHMVPTSPDFSQEIEKKVASDGIIIV